MKSRILHLSILPLVAAVVCIAPVANATLTMNTALQSISQLGDGSSAVYVGHIVLAGTNLNRLVAGGNFNATCASTYTGSISGERTLSSTLIARYNQLYVTIPEQLPALLIMPGFENVPAGTILSCSYNWTSRAQESTYTVGVPGFGITIGGEEARDGSSVWFQMYKTADGGEPNRGCMH